MQESKRIIKLFNDLYNGSPWIDVNITTTLKDITAQQASKKILPGRNSIWEIVNHIISWRLNVLQRVQGKAIASPDDNYFVEIKDASALAWKNTLKQLKDSQTKWIDFLKKHNEKNFEKIYKVNGMSYYEHIHGIIQHDAYHLGQIILLTKLL